MFKSNSNDILMDWMDCVNKLQRTFLGAVIRMF
jgi:hypothetical protein